MLIWSSMGTRPPAGISSVTTVAPLSPRSTVIGAVHRCSPWRRRSDPLPRGTWRPGLRDMDRIIVRRHRPARIQATFFGGRVSFADGRSARLKRRLFRARWEVVEGGSVVLADGRAMGPWWPPGSRELAVRVDQRRLAAEDAVTIAETFRLDNSRRKRRPGVIIDALNRHRPAEQRGFDSVDADQTRGNGSGPR